jgi:hypothetical protein
VWVRMPLVTGEQQAASTVATFAVAEAVMAQVCHVLTPVNVRVALRIDSYRYDERRPPR